MGVGMEERVPEIVPPVRFRRGFVRPLADVHDHAAWYPAFSIKARRATTSSPCPCTVTPFVSGSTTTASTPAIVSSRSLTALSQRSQPMPGTMYVTSLVWHSASTRHLRSLRIKLLDRDFGGQRGKATYSVGKLLILSGGDASPASGG